MQDQVALWKALSAEKIASYRAKAIKQLKAELPPHQGLSNSDIRDLAFELFQNDLK